MEILIGILFVTAVIRQVPRAIEDLVVAWRASKAGEWEVLRARQDVRDAQSKRRAALAQTLLDRQQRQSDDPRRPGVGAVLGDLYHDACERALEHRRKARADDRSSPVADRVDERLKGGVKPVPADPLPIRHCPDCGQPLTEAADGGWVHPGGLNCPKTGRPYRRPSPGPQPSPKTGGETMPIPTADARQPIRDFGDWDDCGNAICGICGRSVENIPGFGRLPCSHCHPQSHAERSKAAVAQRPSNNTGGNVSTPVEEVQTNEAARRAFKMIGEGAAELAEAAALAERARAKMAAAAEGAADGMSGIKFDAGATAAAAEAVDAIGTDTLSDWSEKADAAGSAAQSGLAALDKYRDAEDVVASNDVDPATLAASQS